MTKKRGLGKGLAALLGEEASGALLARQENANGVAENDWSNGGAILQLAITRLVPNPYQPRKAFDEQALAALADSIAAHGIIQPIAVRAVGDYYEIIAGERRFRAAKRAGLEVVPVVIHEVDDADSAAFALIENIQREDLNAIEKAKGISQLVDKFSLTHAECAKLLGQSRASISNTLRLLTLSEVVQQAIVDHQIEMGHARALISVDNATQQQLLKQITLNGLSVRETEGLVKQYQSVDDKKPRAQKPDEVKYLETELSKQLDCRVSIRKHQTAGGKVTLNCSDEESFNRLIKKIKSAKK
ncbi:ParB/RepB/Spo0J family partition protein [Ostreibacterium oceani]|nr:ParB/RepB/Spo0J family partition protein [Ostreibacterium oceani]